MSSAAPEPPITTKPAPGKPRDPWHFFRSARHSIDGFFEAFRHEPSFREDLIFAALMMPLAIILPVNAVSSAVMIASVLLIIIVELLNSAIEWLIDYLRPERHPLAKRVKDMASAAVFLSFVNCFAVWGVIILANWRRIQSLEFLRWPPQFLP